MGHRNDVTTRARAQTIRGSTRLESTQKLPPPHHFAFIDGRLNGFRLMTEHPRHRHPTGWRRAPTRTAGATVGHGPPRVTCPRDPPRLPRPPGLARARPRPHTPGPPDTPARRAAAEGRGTGIGAGRPWGPPCQRGAGGPGDQAVTGGCKRGWGAMSGGCKSVGAPLGRTGGKIDRYPRG